MLTVQERKQILKEFTQVASNIREPIAETKPELFTTITSIDQWVEDNKASFAAITTQLTMMQKLKVFKMVIEGRINGS